MIPLSDRIGEMQIKGYGKKDKTAAARKSSANAILPTV
jgi:hypothetical protein